MLLLLSLGLALTANAAAATADRRVGYVVIDGNGCLAGVVSGKTSTVLHKFKVDLPNKHGKGGSSAGRFMRGRDEAQHNFIRKANEMCVEHFICPDKSTPNVTGLVLAGSADFKNDLFKSQLFDPRLKKIVIDRVNVSASLEKGFTQAVKQSAETLLNLPFIEEKKKLAEYMNHIDRDSGLYCYQPKDTLYALEQGAVQTLLLWESHPMADMLKEKAADHGARLQLVSERSEDGSVFVKGYGGVGGILRYKVRFYDDEDFNSPAFPLQFHDEEAQCDK